MLEVNFKNLRFSGEPNPCRYATKKEFCLILKEFLPLHPFESFVKIQLYCHEAVVLTRFTFSGREMLQEDLSWMPYCHRRDAYLIVCETESKDLHQFHYSLEQSTNALADLFNEHKKNWAIYCKGSDFPIHASHDWQGLSKK